MDVFGLLFSFRGRIRRTQFWLGHIALIGLFIAILLLWGGSSAVSLGKLKNIKTATAEMKAQAATSFIWSMLIVRIATSALAAWIGFSLAIKRLHDRGKSAWWVLIFGVPGAIAVAVPYAPVVLAALCAKVWYLIELGFLKGDPGDNKYGSNVSAPPDPSARIAAELLELHRQDFARKSAEAAVTPVTPEPSARVPRTTSIQRPAVSPAPSGFGRRPRTA
jgi:uncharacterized membrane protein YhaH (DUF805 family)